MTRQEMFNKAYIGVILQGGPSVKVAKDGCRSYVYLERGTGRKCGVGQLLTDEELADVGSTIGSVFSLSDDWGVLSDKPKPAWLHSDELSFLSNLQDAHDNPYYLDGEAFIRRFKDDMGKLAKQYELTVPQDWEIVQAKHRECELEI